ncbi:hypothetical protein C1646_676323 [Rhizophagus diaphanus]|nr:hypothetical protein C1646_676323 [Rhizophagus diaphanus] [Rhizophagus sp. MUCL 43196]
MNQLNGGEIKNKKCLKCKIVILEHSYCDTCFLNGQYGRCVDCKLKNTVKNWCQPCNSKRFQQNFDNWTSGNNDIDKLIQNTQLSAKNYHQILEWIPYNKFGKLKYIAEGGFGKVYKASWKDGIITHWDTNYHQWGRCKENNSFVALKSMNNSQNVTFKFINEVY